MRAVEHGWGRPHDGQVDRWVWFVVTAAALATSVVLNLGLDYASTRHPAVWWTKLGLDVGYLGMLIAIVTANRQICATMRVAVWLPFHRFAIFPVEVADSPRPLLRC